MFEILDAVSGDVLNLILAAGEAAAEAAPAAAEAAGEAAQAVTAAAAGAADTAAQAAQTAAAAAAPAADAVSEGAKAAAETARKPGLLDEVKLFFKQGGKFMIVNLCSLTVLLSIIVERSIRLFFSYSTKPSMLLSSVSACLKDGRVDRAIKICRGEDQKKPLQAPIACVFREALQKADTDEVEIAKTIEDALMEFTPRLNVRVNFLWPLSNAAVLIGLVGTILGLISAFKSMGAVAADKRSEVLSAGISEAMNNTAFGLGIAITGTVCHLLISNKAKHMTDELELYSGRLENILVKRINYIASQQEAAGGQDAATHLLKQ